MQYLNIEAERARNNLSKEELASILGVTTKTYYNWINVETPIPSTALLKMSSMFDVSIDYLLGKYSAKRNKKSRGQQA